MKKLLLLLFLVPFTGKILAQANRVIGPAEQKVTDTLCNCLTKHDLSKITSKSQAVALYTKCATQNIGLLVAYTNERKVDMHDDDAMNKIGTDLGTNLLKMQCPGFLSISSYLMLKDDGSDANLMSSTTGTLKRIDNKGFNYLVISDNGIEKSFLWLRQFPGSDQFAEGLGTAEGKPVKITWQEIEVYLPTAKGYFNVKEITEISFLQK